MCHGGRLTEGLEPKLVEISSVFYIYFWIWLPKLKLYTGFPFVCLRESRLPTRVPESPEDETFFLVTASLPRVASVEVED